MSTDFRIVAIGGGDISTGETLLLDRLVVEMTNARKPRALFLPTASFDSRDYWTSYRQAYSSLGCECDALFLWDGYSPAEIESVIQRTKWNTEPHRWDFRGDLRRVQQAIDDADLVYVGGGNTRRLLELWRSIGLDDMLRKAAARGLVLSGLSAGCICWGRYGNSDAALTEGLGKPTMRVDCLDFLPIALCPHMSGEPFRLEEFKVMMRETPGIGIGLDVGCALVHTESGYRIVSCLDGASAHVVTAEKHERIGPGDLRLEIYSG